jgi:GDSL-like Lipase/Acylhydrolase family
MRTLTAGPLLAGLFAAVLAGPVLAAEEGACYVAGSLVHADFALPRVAAAIERKHVSVVVLGSASSTLPGTEGAAKAYPARLQESLTRRLGEGTTVKVVSRTKARDTASEMVKTLRQVVSEDKPDLVIWQTGTVDAMLGVDPDEFQAALGTGLDVVRAGNSDAVFVNMQYSPRTDSMIALTAYVDAIRFVALQREIPLFDRLAVMKDWNEMGVFDLSTATKKIDVAEKVHDCIGRMLGRLIVDGAMLAKTNLTGVGNVDVPNKDNH